MKEDLELLEEVIGHTEDYQRGFKDAIKYMRDEEPQEEEDDQTQKVDDNVDLRDRYPLEKDKFDLWNRRRFEYELVVLFSNRENTNNLTIYNIFSAMFDWNNIQSQDQQYQKISDVLRESDRFQHDSTVPYGWFLAPSVEAEEIGAPI
jgi:hypothetical protein